jgi:hypothetical protein
MDRTVHTGLSGAAKRKLKKEKDKKELNFLKMVKPMSSFGFVSLSTPTSEESKHEIAIQEKTISDKGNDVEPLTPVRDSFQLDLGAYTGKQGTVHAADVCEVGDAESSAISTAHLQEQHEVRFSSSCWFENTTDPAMWEDINDDVRKVLIDRGPNKFQNRSQTYPASARLCGPARKRRVLTNELLQFRLKNGQVFSKIFKFASACNLQCHHSNQIK